MVSEGVFVLVDAVIRTSWGYSRITSFAPHVKVAFGSDWEIWKRSNASYIGFFVKAGSTSSTIATTQALIETWFKSNGIDTSIAVPTAPQPTTPLPAYFTVRSTPTGAKIFLDSANTGKTTNARIEVLPGQHRIAVDLTGYYPRFQDTTATAGTSKTIEFTLSSTTPPPEAVPAPTTGITWEQMSPTEQTEMLQAIENMPRGTAYAMGPEDIMLYMGLPSLLSVATKLGKGLLSYATLSLPKFAPLGEAGFIKIIQTQPAAATGLEKAIAKNLVQEVAEGSINSEKFALAINSAKPSMQKALAQAIYEATESATTKAISVLTSTKNGRIAFVNLQPYLKALGKPALAKIAKTIMQVSQIVSLPLMAIFAATQIPQLFFLSTFARTEIPSTVNFQLKKYEDSIETLFYDLGTAIKNKDAVRATAIKTQIEENIAAYEKYVNESDFQGTPVKRILIDNNMYEPTITMLATFKAKLGQAQEQEISILGPEVPPGIPGEVPTGKGRLQLIIYDKATNTRVKMPLLVNGILQPYTLDAYNIDLPEGAHEIVLEKDGWQRNTDTIYITAGKVEAINVFMEETAEPEIPMPPTPPEPPIPPEPTKGRLQITANVTASIFSGGADTGNTTPALIELLPGIYDITLSAEGFADETKTGYVKAGETYSLAFLLTSTTAGPITKKAWRQDIDSAPSGAKILVNYAFTGKWTPDYVLLDPGIYIISMVKSGFKRWNQAITLEEF